MTIADIPKVDRLLKKEFKAHSAPIIELIEAQTHDPFCVLVGTILSARLHGRRGETPFRGGTCAALRARRS